MKRTREFLCKRLLPLLLALMVVVVAFSGSVGATSGTDAEVTSGTDAEVTSGTDFPNAPASNSDTTEDSSEFTSSTDVGTDEEPATSWASGTGTQADPYIVSNVAQLQYMAEQYTAAAIDHYAWVKLADASGNPVTFDLTGVDWTPIVTDLRVNIDGNGSTIANMNIEKAQGRLGFFGWPKNSGEIKDLSFTGCRVVNTAEINYTGIVVGSSGLTFTNVDVTNSYVEGSKFVAAVLGYGGGIFDNCTVSGTTIKSRTHSAAALCGSSESATNKASGCVVSGCTIIATHRIGAVFGLLQVKDGQSAVNCTVTNTTLDITTEAGYKNYPYGLICSPPNRGCTIINCRDGGGNKVKKSGATSDLSLFVTVDDPAQASQLSKVSIVTQATGTERQDDSLTVGALSLTSNTPNKLEVTENANYVVAAGKTLTIDGGTLTVNNAGELIGEDPYTSLLVIGTTAGTSATIGGTTLAAGTYRYNVATENWVLVGDTPTLEARTYTAAYNGKNYSVSGQFITDTAEGDIKLVVAAAAAADKTYLDGATDKPVAIGCVEAHFADTASGERLLWNPYSGNLELTIPVDSKYNSMEITVLHGLGYSPVSTHETLTATAAADKISVTVGGLSPFGLYTVKSIESIALAAPQRVAVGKQVTVTPTILPEGFSASVLTWSSDDNDIATVSTAGVVTGVTMGVVKITATAPNGVSDSVYIDVIKYSKRTIESPDATLGVTVSGQIIEDDSVALVVTKAAAADEAFLDSKINPLEDLGAYDIRFEIDGVEIDYAFTGKLTLTFAAGNNNGKYFKILHRTGTTTYDTYKGTIENKKATCEVSSLSPFAVYRVASEGSGGGTGDSWAGVCIAFGLLLAAAIAMVFLRRRYGGFISEKSDDMPQASDSSACDSLDDPAKMA